MSKKSWYEITLEEEREREQEEREEREQEEREKQELEALYGKKKKKKKRKRKKNSSYVEKAGSVKAVAHDSASAAASSVAKADSGVAKADSGVAVAVAKPTMTALERMANQQKKQQKGYRKREHRDAALQQLIRLNADFYASGDAFIKPGESVFREFPLFSGCPDIHFHVYNGGAGIRFRFEDGSELQFNDDYRQYGVVLTRWRGARVRDLVLPRDQSNLGKAKFANLVNNKVSNSWNFKNTEAGAAVKELYRIGKLADFLEEIERYVITAAGAGTKDGSKGGRRKTRKRKRKRGKKKTIKNKKKRKTRRKKKYRKKRTKRRR